MDPIRTASSSRAAAKQSSAVAATRGWRSRIVCVEPRDHHRCHHGASVSARTAASHASATATVPARLIGASENRREGPMTR